VESYPFERIFNIYLVLATWRWRPVTRQKADRRFLGLNAAAPVLIRRKFHADFSEILPQVNVTIISIYL
jgi:hypothetical protein